MQVFKGEFQYSIYCDTYLTGKYTFLISILLELKVIRESWLIFQVE